MLTPGNRKLGERLVWGFGLPSGQQEICIGMTPTCQQHCYAIRFGKLDWSKLNSLWDDGRLSCEP